MCERIVRHHCAGLSGLDSVCLAKPRAYARGYVLPARRAWFSRPLDRRTGLAMTSGPALKRRQQVGPAVRPGRRIARTIECRRRHQTIAGVAFFYSFRAPPHGEPRGVACTDHFSPATPWSFWRESRGRKSCRTPAALIPIAIRLFIRHAVALAGSRAGKANVAD